MDILAEESGDQPSVEAVGMKLKKKHVKKSMRNFGLPVNPYNMSKSIEVAPMKFR